MKDRDAVVLLRGALTDLLRAAEAKDPTLEAKVVAAIDALRQTRDVAPTVHPGDGYIPTAVSGRIFGTAKEWNEE